VMKFVCSSAQPVSKVGITPSAFPIGIYTMVFIEIRDCLVMYNWLAHNPGTEPLSDIRRHLVRNSELRLIHFCLMFVSSHSAFCMFICADRSSAEKRGLLDQYLQGYRLFP